MCIGCVLRFLVCGGYVSKGRVCHMWGCECVLPVMGCLVGVSFLWCMLVGVGAYILEACLQVLAIMCVPCLFLFSIVSK